MPSNQPENALTVNALGEHSLFGVDEKVASLSDAALARATSVNIRLSHKLLLDLRDPVELRRRERLRGRIGSLPLHLYSYSQELHCHVIHQILHPGEIDDSATDIERLGRIRYSEISRLLDKVGSLPMHHSGSSTFVAPSGRFCDTYFRGANVLYTAESIETLAFWCLPYIDGCQAILLDTWGIAPIAYRACSLLGDEISITAFEAHPYYRRRDAKTILRTLAKRSLGDGRVACLVSVGSTGRFESTVTELALEVGFSAESLSIQPIFMLSEAAAARPAVFSMPVEACSVPEEILSLRATKLRIDETLYYPRPSPERKVAPKGVHWGFAKGRWGTEDATTPWGSTIDLLSRIDGALSVHANHMGKHFSMFVDVERTTRASQFMEVLEETLEKWRGPQKVDVWHPEVVLYAREPASRLLGELIAEHYNLIAKPAFGSDSDVDSIRGKHVIYAKEATASGDSLKNEYAELRNADFEPASISYVVALARGSAAEHKELLTHLVGGSCPSGVTWVLRLPLPTDGRCSWCEEKDILRSSLFEYLSSGVAEPQWMLRRFDHLDTTQLRSDLFLHIFGETDGTVSTGSQMFRKGWSSLAVCFRIGCALQLLRDEGTESERLAPGYFRSQVLDVRFVTRFTERLLKTAFLRIANPEDWGYQQQDALADDLVKACNEAPSGFLGECALMFQRGVFVPARGRSLHTSLSEAAKVDRMSWCDPDSWGPQ